MPLGDPVEARGWLQILRADGVGGQRARQLVEQFGSAAAAIAAGPRGWRQAGLPAAASEALSAVDHQQLDADLRWLEAERHHLIHCRDDDYPALLAAAPNPPAVLLIRGDPSLLWQPQVAVVGSRNPTAGGRDNAQAFAEALAQSGLTITSGLAEGIDAAAHRAALDCNGATIAVMGTGPDRIYPASNRRLAESIIEHGALVSELPLGTGARRDHFPRRNRIVVGLALGTLVVEAALQSGALISARLAAETGREVFALPGSIHNPLARGCHRLIRDGANLVETADEIVAALGSAAEQLAQHLRRRLERPLGTPARSAPEIDGDYQRVLDALGHDPTAMEQLVGRTGLTVDALSSMLLVLELDGRVAAVNGRYARRGS